MDHRVVDVKVGAYVYFHAVGLQYLGGIVNQYVVIAKTILESIILVEIYIC